jgi:hypothetical protein
MHMTSLLARCGPGRLFGLIAVVALAGCSGHGVNKVTVNGTITYKGQPLRSGFVKLVGSGTTSAGVIQPDGTFIITDVVPGEVKAFVVEAPQGTRSPSPEETKSSGARKPPPPLPERYRDPETAGLTYTITPETKELLIDIK